MLHNTTVNPPDRENNNKKKVQNKLENYLDLRVLENLDQ